MSAPLFIYNPALLTREQAIERFLVREGVLRELLENLAREEPRHILLSGSRGLGKTTLLYRLRFAILEDASLNARWWPLSFPEEQYNVLQLSDFFLNCLDALADSFEQLGRGQDAARIDARVKVLGPRPDAERVRDILIEEGQRLQRTFVLLVDNAERVLDSIESAEEKVLARLFSQKTFVFVGASSNAFAEAFQQGAPFERFFKQLALTPLTLDETRRLLAGIAEQLGSSHVMEWLADPSPGRLTALHLLSGGNPRTIAMLYTLLARGRSGDIKAELDELLDQVTPLYKARLDEVAEHSQTLFYSVAQGWPRALTAREIAVASGLDVNNVSSQLNRLVKQGILEKSEDREKKTTFQIAERFFNLWFIMRASRRVRQQIRRYAEFLQLLYDAQQIREQAEAYLRDLRAGRDPNPWYRFILVAAVEAPELKRRLRITKAGAKESIPDWLSEAEEFRSKGDYRTAENLCREQIAADSADPTAWEFLGRILDDHLGNFEAAEQALRRATELDPRYETAWNRLGNVLFDHLKRPDEAFEAYTEVLRIDPTAAYAHHNIALVHKTKNRLKEAEIEYRRALALSPKYAVAWNGLGLLLLSQAEREQEAAEALQKAIQYDAALRYPRTNLLQLATRVVRRDDWTGARALAYRALANAGESLRGQLLNTLIDDFLNAAALRGHVEDCLGLLNELQLSESWVALNEALSAVSKDVRHLDTLVPEVQKPAREIYERLQRRKPQTT